MFKISAWYLIYHFLQQPESAGDEKKLRCPKSVIICHYKGWENVRSGGAVRVVPGEASANLMYLDQNCIILVSNRMFCARLPCGWWSKIVILWGNLAIGTSLSSLHPTRGRKRLGLCSVKSIWATECTAQSSERHQPRHQRPVSNCCKCHSSSENYCMQQSRPGTVLHCKMVANTVQFINQTSQV